MTKARRGITDFAPHLSFPLDLGLKGSAPYAGAILTMRTLHV
jgi:hypothetical protein